MNSIERVQKTLAYEHIDRVPLGFYLVDCDTISKVIGRKTFVRNRIEQQLALWSGRRDEVAESLKKDTVEFYRKIDLCDIITFKEAALLPPKDYQPAKMRKVSNDIYEDDAGRVYKISELSNEFVCVEDPTAKDKEYTLADFPDDTPIKPHDESIFEAYDYLVEQLGQERFILGPAPLAATPMLGGMENGLIQYVANPDTVRAAIRYFLRHHNALDRQMIRPGQQGVLMEQDYGTTRASILSPKMFRDFGFPVLQSRTKNIKQFVKYVFLHSCGNCWDLIDMFIESGIDAYQSLQTGAGMDLNLLKDRFHNRIAFWGGIAMEILVKGTPEEVRKNVKHAVNTAKTRKGIILGPSHSIAYGVPYDNFLAMMDEFHKNAYYS